MAETQKKVVIVDFGGQYAHLISRRVKEYGAPVEIIRPNQQGNVKDARAIILSGGARSVYEKNAPLFDKSLLNLKVPVLGICYGHQLLAHHLGGQVVKGKAGEYGPTDLSVPISSNILSGVPKQSLVWMNHKDSVLKLPKGFAALAKTKEIPIAAFADVTRHIYGVQFHPEVTHTKYGGKIIENFLKVAEVKKAQKSLDISEMVSEAKNAIGTEKAIVGLSGGVDSSVAAVLVSKAIGKNLLAVYVDTGLMRAGETEEISKIFKKFPFYFKVVDASKLFFKALKGVTDPEEKRKRIGKLFIEVFDKEAKTFKATYLVQGTIYSDRIESGHTKFSSRIKSHHNVGGLPKNMKLSVYEPLRDLYKDEVRLLAAKAGLPQEIIERKVFPGPGLAIRIIGEVTPEKVNIVQRADIIIQEELGKTIWKKKVWMAFPVLLSIRSVGIQGDARSYKYPIVLRIIESKDAMTANFAKIPYPILEKIATRITNEIGEVNRVVYDISNKPPATMEWE